MFASKWLTTGLLVLGASGALGLASMPPQAGKAVPTLVSWSGPHSRVTAGEFVRVSSAAEWAQLWKRHLAEAPPDAPQSRRSPGIPEVNFDACTAVAIFKGNEYNSNGVVIASISETEDRVVLRFDERTFQTAGPGGGGVAVTPFGIFILPRTTKPIVVEENVQDLKDHPEKWKERARL